MIGYFGVDVGGTGTSAGLFDDRRNLLVMKTFPTLGTDREWFGNPEAYMDLLASELNSIADGFPSLGRPSGIGIGVPGSVDPDSGIVKDATNLGWTSVALAEGMTRRMRIPVRIDHDVRSFAWGEAKAGAARGCGNAIFVTIGTGIAAGILIDGKLVRGANHYAGEIGHDSVSGLDTVCACGKIGCLETVVSAPGIARLARERGIRPLHASGSLTARDIYGYGAEGDSEAREIFRYAASLLAGKLETAIALLDPQMIVIGGGVAEAGELLLGPLREIIYKQLPWLEGKLVIVKGELGGDASVIGALYSIYP